MLSWPSMSLIGNVDNYDELVFICPAQKGKKNVLISSQAIPSERKAQNSQILHLFKGRVDGFLWEMPSFFKS